MIDIRKLKELIRLMSSNDLVELDLRDKDEQVTIRRPNPVAAPQVIHAPMHMAAAPAAPAPVAAAPATAPAAAPAAADSTAGLLKIESPMVGTFYASPSPDKPAFITAGASVGPGTVVCLVEAMKIFNEINAGVSGTVERILVKSGDPVEFGQVLFLVKPS
jgi:acetyl-CoA carboxylase biotin carboxyl carrier protein